MPDDFDDDAKTPEQGRMRPLTDSELEFFKVKYTSGVPVVSDDFEREDTSPIDIFERSPRSASDDLAKRLKKNPERLIPFLAEFAEWAVAKHRERSSAEQSALAELRELLSKPPDGATKRLQEESRGHAEAIGELADRIDEIERAQEKTSELVAKINEAIEKAKGRGWKAASAIGVTIAGSAVAIVATLQASAEKSGAAAERVLNHGARLDRIERRLDETPSRPSRRDYDYDITPRPFVAPKKEP